MADEVYVGPDRKLTEAGKQKVLDVTFSTDYARQVSWGWRIPNNPARELGKLTEEEKELTRIAAEGIPQVREESRTKTYTYWAPFNYPNVEVELGRPNTGVEFNPDGAELDIYPYGYITIEEEEPIVAVTTIGSGCGGGGWVCIEAEPVVWKYPRTAVRMMQDGLWGIHVRIDAWRAVGEAWNDAGFSSARFDLPESKRVIIGGGSQGADPHYCFRIVRVEVKESL